MKRAKRLFTWFVAIALAFAFVPGLWAQQGEEININTASVEELIQLKRIGPKYAERIVQYREAHGPFERPEDVMKVPGIGPKTWDANKDCITVK